MQIDIYNTQRKYRLIYADPAWKYRDEMAFKRVRASPAGAKKQYNLMSIEEICNLPVKDITDKNAVCFLWVTTAFLPEGLRVLEAWGFNYKVSIYWYKINYMGMGYWFRNSVEQCFIGIHGKVKAFNKQYANVIRAKPKKHSQKPRKIYQIMESVDLAPKIELFAREQKESWDCWGNEIPRTIQKRL